MNDLVEDIHRLLVPENPKYRSLLRATHDGHAVEGSLSMDDALAAIMIRDKAKALNTELANEKLGPIKHALQIVLRRYRLSRKQRRNMVHGELVQIENGAAASSDE